MHLDLDDPFPFWSIIREYDLGHADALRLCRCDDRLVSSIAAYGDLPDALTRTLNLFVESARKRVESVAAYHGCRVLDEASYRVGGIRRPKSAELISWCKAFFGQEARIDGIVRDLGSDYLKHGESGVFCMKGIEAAKRNGCCHHEGSELVRSIARRLGPDAEQKYYATGRPCFVEVCTPMKWFERYSRGSADCLLRNVFVHWLWTEFSLEWSGDPREGGITFEADIPARFVKAFHYLE